MKPTIRLAALLASAVLLPRSGQAIWAGASTGTTLNDAHKYLLTANWVSSTIDDSFVGFTLTGATTLYFDSDRTTTAGVDTSYGGNFALALEGTGGDRTLTLGGDVTHQTAGGTTAQLTLGNATVGKNLSINLGGATRTFNCGTTSTGRNITVHNPASNGGIVKAGAGSLTLNGANTYSGTTTVNQGTLVIGGSILNTTSPIIVVPKSTVDASLENRLLNGTNNRLGDGTSIVLESGSQSAFLAQTINGSVDAVEDIGPIVLRSGRGRVQQGNRQTTGAGNSNAFIRCNADCLTRENRSVAFFAPQRSTAETPLINNPNLGVRRDAAGDNLTDAGNQIFFDTVPAAYGGTNGRGTDSPVVPFLHTIDSSAGSSTPNALMTCSATSGLRTLRIQADNYGNAAEFVASIASANADGLDNVRTTGAETVSAAKTVNALILASGNTTIAADTTLTLGSGVIMFKGGSLVGSDYVTSVINFGTNEGVLVHIDGSVVNVSTALTGSGGLTIFGSPYLYGKNTYSGQTTVVDGRSIFYRTGGTAANANDSVPDNGLVLIHPGAIFQAGANNAAYQTQEIVGDVAGSGAIALGNITNTTIARRSALIIGTGGSGAVGEVTLDGGSIAPGLLEGNKVGTLSVTVDQGSSTPIPVTLKKGTLKINLAGASPNNDKLAVTGATTVTAGGTLSLDVNVSGFTPTVGQQWTVLTASSVTDGNGDALVDTVTDNVDGIDFEASISGGNAVVLTAVSGLPAATVILVR